MPNFRSIRIAIIVEALIFFYSAVKFCITNKREKLYQNWLVSQMFQIFVTILKVSLKFRNIPKISKIIKKLQIVDKTKLSVAFQCNY